MYHSDDTICAIASAPAGAARGIVRVSGPATIAILQRLFRSESQTPLEQLRAATVLAGTVPLADSQVVLDVDVYLWPRARSYTRQDAAEIHTVGSPPLLSALVRTVCAAGARLAEPGEFTLRAFLAGRLDLTQAEAVLGVIDARSDQQFHAALEQLAGGLGQPLHHLRGTLLDLLAHLEAGLDFVEDDIQFVTADELNRQLADATAQIERITEQLGARTRNDDLPRVVLVGSANVGKSSLFNRLTRGAALVSSEPGTTRDYLTATLDLGNVRCQLIDTAGVESKRHQSVVADQAAALAAKQRQNCDIRLLCLDSGREPDEWERMQMAANHSAAQLVVLTKCDAGICEGPLSTGFTAGAIATSAVTGVGIEALGDALRAALVEIERGDSAAALSAERCDESLREAGESLKRAGTLAQASAGEELIAAEIRSALADLGKVVGAVYTDDILDRVFSRFCIGK
jgi:tRNA modification GTPase